MNCSQSGNNEQYDSESQKSYVSDSFNGSMTESSSKDTSMGSNESYYSYSQTMLVVNDTQHSSNIGSVGGSQQSSYGDMSTQNSWACTQPENQNWDYDMKSSQSSGASTNSLYDNSMLCQALNDWEMRQVSDSQMCNAANEWEQNKKNSLF